MTVVFYLAAAIAILATILTITRLNPVHALLYLVVSLLAVAVVFFLLGAPFVAALEVIIYAGAVMVLFVFVVMMLNLGTETVALERRWFQPRMLIGPTILAAILVAEIAFLLAHGRGARLAGETVDPRQVALALYQPYLIGVELASFLLMGGVVGAYHLGARRTPHMRRRPHAGAGPPSVASGERMPQPASERQVEQHVP